MYQHKARYVRTTSRFLLSAVVATIVSVSAMSQASAGPGECIAGVTPDAIDTCYFDWLAATGFDPVSAAFVSCSDAPEDPAIEIRLADSDPNFAFNFRVTLNLQVDGGLISIAAARGQQDPPFDEIIFCDTFQRGLNVPQRHICRAAVLRSAPWRQICQTQVHSAD